jgi:hypothetical protein
MSWIEEIKTAQIAGDTLKAREVEIAALREIIDSALRSVANVELNYEPLEAWWPAQASNALRQLDMVVGR